MKIIVDAMGGDNAPKEIVKGSVEAVEKLGVEVVLVGREEAVKAELAECGYNGEAITVHNAEEVISNDDDPIAAIRHKKDSSMRVGLSLLAKGEGDAFVSAGSTGALISGATLIVKRIKGIRRAALAPVLPSVNGNYLLIDSGATAECTPGFLKQFGIMGSVYMKKVMGIENPRVGLVNIGTEEEKGTEVIRQANKLLKEVPINYIGYVESREVPLGGADVVVCDGFTGNVILKFMEGMGSAFSKMLKGVFFKNAMSKVAALIVKSGIKEIKASMDYTEHGGAPVLGVRGPVVKAHGSSNAKAFYNAIRQCKKIVDGNLVGDITDGIAEYGLEEDEAE